MSAEYVPYDNDNRPEDGHAQAMADHFAGDMDVSRYRDHSYGFQTAYQETAKRMSELDGGQDRADHELNPRLGGCGCQYDAAGRLFLPRCVCPDRFQRADELDR